VTGHDDQMGLFGQPVPRGREVPVDPVEADADTRALASRLPAGVHLGTSSWSFPGWAGLVWAGETSEAVLAKRGLPAYAAHPLHRTVGLDRAFYRPLSIDTYRELADQTPVGFRFLIKAWQGLTRPDADEHGRTQGSTSALAQAGVANPAFLDATEAEDRVVAPAVLGLGDRIGPIVFQFPPLDLTRSGLEPRRLIARVGEFLEALPRKKDRTLYAVEFRNRQLFEPRWSRELASVLRAGGASLGFAHHPSLPSIDEQRRAMEAGGWPVEAQPAVVCRWLLRHGMGYDEARTRYSPFRELAEPDRTTRRQIAGLIRTGTLNAVDGWVIANNKAEGSAPLTVRELAHEIAHADPAAG
jgi:uncharacterized protein YecE (DUF72 family)